MNYSENYNFALPEDEDGYDVQAISDNFDSIDGLLAENESQMENINEKIGTPAEAGQTLFSLLSGNTASVFRSIQRVVCHCDTTEGGSVSINEVDPAKCIVLMERLGFPHDRTVTVNYGLSATSIRVDHSYSPAYSIKLGFWVLELA